MLPRYTYLLVDLCCILVPFLASFHPAIKFYRQWRYFIAPCLLTALFFIVWDMWFTHIGVWQFNPNYVIGAYIGNLPVEELAFFVCIPYSCTFTFYCCHRFIKKKLSFHNARIFTMALVLVLLSIAFSHLLQLYTSVTFLLLSGLLIYLLAKKVTYLPIFYISFLLILLPFFISNGILTGSFIKEPVVIYNNHYNLGIRMFTIPVEDTFYGMLLLLMNTSGYMYLSNKRHN